MEFKNPPPPEKINLKTNKHKAFTLSEVLITLVIIGIVAAITVPILMHQWKWKQYRAGLLKAKGALEQAVILYKAQNGVFPECGYWSKNPHDCHAICTERNEKGECIKYACNENGQDLPEDYNGNFKDCNELYMFLKTNMNVIKICNGNALQNGCIPIYNGIDTVFNIKNPDKSEYDSNVANSGCPGWKQNTILNGGAFVTADGMIFFPYYYFTVPIIAVDVNGQKGPNKWGHDIHPFIGQRSEYNGEIRFAPGGCEFIEYGGIEGTKLLYGKEYM